MSNVLAKAFLRRDIFYSLESGDAIERKKKLSLHEDKMRNPV